MQAKSHSNGKCGPEQTSTLETPPQRVRCGGCGAVFHHAGWDPLEDFPCINCNGPLQPADGLLLCWLTRPARTTWTNMIIPAGRVGSVIDYLPAEGGRPGRYVIDFSGCLTVFVVEVGSPLIRFMLESENGD